MRNRLLSLMCISLIAFGGYSLVRLATRLGITSGFVESRLLNLGKAKVPSNSGWESIFAQNSSKTENSVLDFPTLNYFFIGGWEDCCSNFLFLNREWKYEVIVNSQPWLLSGNMPDNERLAMQTGWSEASDCIEEMLEKTDANTLRSNDLMLSKKLIAPSVAICVGIFGLFLSNRKPREAVLSKNSAEGFKH